MQILIFLALASFAQNQVPAQRTPSVQEVKINQERDKLQSLRQELSRLEQERQEQERKAALALPAQISDSNNQIADLMSVLDEQRLAEEDINRNAEMALGQQSSAARLQREQIDRDIYTTENDIRRLTEELRFKTMAPPATPEQAAEIDNMRNQLAASQERLSTLRSDRVNLSTSFLAQQQAINADVQSATAQLRDNETNIRSQIADLRDEIAQARTENNRAKMSLASLNDQIKQQRQEVSEQEKVVQNLQQPTAKR
jgi:chromosome segregation ATPase